MSQASAASCVTSRSVKSGDQNINIDINININMNMDMDMDMNMNINININMGRKHKHRHGQNMTGSQCCSMAQGSQWVWEVIESYCCGEEGHVSGEELSSADENQQQTKRQTV